MNNTEYIYNQIGFKGFYKNKDKSLKELLKEFYETCKNCTKCELSKNRTKVVFGDGNPDSKILFVGEAPGADEDLEGRPFVGKAGRLLTANLESIGIFREKDYYITNIAKCRPPDNRTPEESEMVSCSYILKKEIELIKPRLIIALGRTAAVGLTGLKNISPTKLRGDFIKSTNKSPVLAPNTNVFITYHPSFLLRNPSQIKNFQEDLAKIKSLIKRG